MKKNINLEIGERVRLTRISRGYSREELAEYLGISALFLGYIECGQRGMSLMTMQNMCRVLNVSADYMLLGKEAVANSREQIEDAIKDLDERYYPLAIESINNLKRMIFVIEKSEAEKQAVKKQPE